MSPLKVTRLVGHGARPAQSFTQSPVKLGTNASCTLKFDPGWDKGVADRHAVIEQTPRGWVWRDLAGTTLCNGVLMYEPQLIDGAMDFELSPGGVRLRVEGEAVEAAAPPPAAPTSRGQGPPPALQPSMAAVPQQRPQARAPQRSTDQTRVVLVVAAAAIALIAAAGVIGGAVYWIGKSKPKVTYPPRLPEPSIASSPPASSPAPIPVPTPPPAPVPAPPAPVVPVPSPAVAGAGLPPLPAIAQQNAEKLKKIYSIHTALVEFWRAENSRSPYVKAALRYEDHWLAEQVSWLNAWGKSGGRDTGKGSLDFPGIFIPEAVYAGTEDMGIPMMPESMVARVVSAVAERAPGAEPAAYVASRSMPESQAVMPPPAPLAKLALVQRMSEYAGSGQTQGVADGAGGAKAWAVLVGINRFEDAPPPPGPSGNLAGCRNDVAAIGKVLMTQGIFVPERVRLLTDARKGTSDYPSKDNVVAALKEVVQNAGPQDIVLVAFSTHGGYAEKYKESFLAMADKPLLGIELLKIFEHARAKNIVMSMDACHTGGMEVIGNSHQEAVAAQGGAQKSEPIPEAFYEQLGASRGHVVIRACRFDQTTPDIRTYGHGILTATMVSGLTGDADRDNDGIVTLSELRVYVTTAIPKITRRALELSGNPNKETPLQPTFTSSGFGEAGDLPLTIVPKAAR